MLYLTQMRLKRIAFYCMFETLSHKDNAVLLGGCASFSGSVVANARFSCWRFVKLGAWPCLSVRRIFFGYLT